MPFRPVALAAALLVAGLSPAAAVCPGLDVLLQDQFEVLQPTWSGAGSAVQVDQGRLVMSPPAGTEAWIVSNAALHDDIDMCVTVTTVAGIDPETARVGAIFWYDDVNNFYVFEIAPNGKASVWRRQRGRWLAQIDWRDAAGANKDDEGVNELRVTTVGNDATFYVNGTEFGTLEGEAPPDGQQVGLYAGSPDDDAATFAFDGLRMTTP